MPNLKKAEQLNQERLKKLLEHAWLNLGDTSEIEIANPMGSWKKSDQEDPVRAVLRLLRKPEYFAWTCKLVFNVEILPLQLAILWDLWTHPFPMLIGSRGLGKSFILALYAMLRAFLCQGVKIVIVGAAFRQSKVIFEYCEHIWNHAPILRDICGTQGRSGPRRDVDRCTMILGDSIILALPLGDGCLSGETLITFEDGFGCMRDEHSGTPTQITSRHRKVWSSASTDFVDSDEAYYNGVMDTKVVTTNLGLRIEGTLNHRLRVLDGLEVVWKRLDEIRPGDRLLVDRSWRWHLGHENSTSDEAYALGLMIGDGCWTNPYHLGFATKDAELAEALSRGTGLLFYRCGDDVHYKHDGKPDRSAWLRRWGLKTCRAGEKELPPAILRADRATMAACISGLFDTDGHVQVGGAKGGITVAFTNTSETLVRQLQYILLHFGIISVLRTRKRSEKWATCHELLITGEDVRLFAKHIGFRLRRKKERLENALSEAKRTGSFADEIPHVQAEMLRVATANRIPKGKRDKTLDAVRPTSIARKRFITRRFADIFLRKYAYTNDAFLKKLKELANQDVYYDTVTGIEDGRTETFDVHVPGTHEYCAGGFFSHNTKIRGQRANYIIADEFASIPREIFETVVSGFSVVASDPVEQVKKAARIRMLKEKGLWTEEMEAKELGLGDGNQTILSGTAYYDFNHFADYWKRWKAIIESRGNPRRLAEIFGGEENIPPKFNHRDFSIIRIPVELLPEGFMDAKHVARSKATVHAGIYQMEFGACGSPETPVITDRGVKCLADVDIGDRVLTHKGRFRKVIGLTRRHYRGVATTYRCNGSNFEHVLTPDHPFWTGDDSWSPLRELMVDTKLSNLRELSGRETIDVRDYVKDYAERDGYVYPRGSRRKLDHKRIHELRQQGLSQSEIGRRIGVRQSAIYAVLHPGPRPKNAILKTLPLNRDLGLILGYYASEGSVGADGRSVSFALDGHVNTRLESYVSQLVSACEQIFGFTPKLYRNDSVMNVTICSRVVASLLSSICPGLSHNKSIDPEALFSNPDFLLGFIEGYWNGDGHLPSTGVPSAHCVNPHLLCQLRVALSYFGISATLSRAAPTKEGQSTFSLVLNGDNARRFRKLVYAQETETTTLRRRLIINEDDASRLCLINKQNVLYDGLVYNLEVEEDHSYSLLNATVHNCFATDSQGFYSRKLIEACVAGSMKFPISLPGYPDIHFTASLRGNPHLKYVFGVDPASERDKFSIVVLECHNNHRRVVFCWTTTRSAHREKIKAKVIPECDFYGYCARKIRELRKVFPCDRIAMDSQGGGVAVAEALHDPDKLQDGELPIWPIREEGKKQDTDDYPGEHILQLCNFASADWTAEANHGMRKDFEDRVLLFPHFDGLSLELSLEDDKRAGRVKVIQGKELKLYDTLEDCVTEIEELKDELATIVHTQTANGRDRWDTPEVKMAGNKKGRLRKDRYSAMLMANMAARGIMRAPPAPTYKPVGGFADKVAGSRDTSSGKLYVMGPEWTMSQRAGEYGAVVRRG